MSESLWYRVYRRMESPALGPWIELTTENQPKVHEYLNGVSDQYAIQSIQTQSYEDAPDVSGSYKYRVAALFDGCELSEGVVTAREVVVSLELGDASGLSATIGQLPGNAILSWTAGANANIHWVAGIAVMADGSYDYGNTVWSKASGNTSHMVSGLTGGTTYLFTVISGRVDGNSEEWGNWTPVIRVTAN